MTQSRPQSNELAPSSQDAPRAVEIRVVPEDALADEPGELAILGQIANRYAGSAVFDDYLKRKAPTTLRAQLADLDTLAEYLRALGLAEHDLDAGRLQHSPAAWRGVTWGLVDGFVRWMLQQGYAISTVNRKLSTIKVYAKLAAKAGVIPAEELALIKGVSGYSRKEGKRVDQRRPQARVGAKKAANVSLTREQARALLDQPNTPQGRRDALLMRLLLDHGLRVGELAGLQVDDADLDAGAFTFYRPKVDKAQTHRMTAGTRQAMARWFAYGDAPASGPLLRASHKGGRLGKPGMSARAITAWVRHLGEQIGVTGLSAHDCRHYWATTAARHGTDAFVLRDAGGWNSLAMPARYVEAQAIANQGVLLGDEEG
jgi:integrase